MEIKGKIEKVGFLSGTFNMLKQDIPITIYLYDNVNKDKIIHLNQYQQMEI